MPIQLTANAAQGSSRLRNFAKKYERPAPPASDAAPAPAPRDNIFERMDTANRIELDNSIDDVIDVTPQTRFMFLFIVFNVMKNYKDLNMERPLLTPSSLVAYCLFQVYAYLLICDYYGRPRTSFPASQFMDNDTRIQLLEAFCQSYVPPFMLTLFHAIADCSDPRRPGLQYFPTLAGSHFTYDFGRLIPAQVFLLAHNVSADEDTSRNPATAMMSLLNETLFAVTNGNPIHVAHYFSAGYTATAHYHSYVYEALYTLFSPVTGKSLLRRSNLQHIPIQTATINPTMSSSNAAYDNQYILYLNANPSNCRSMIKFISAMSALVKSDMSASFQLGAIPDDLNGTNILVHGYCDLALPTWHSAKHVKITATKTQDDEEDYAKAISFLQPATYTSQQKIDYTNIKKNLTGIFKTMLLGQDIDTDFTHGPEHITFDSETHAAPRTLFLDPYTSGDGPISYAMLAGLLIESYEIDGSSVPMPDPRIGLSKNNRQFLQGSVPLSHVHPAHSTAGITPYQPYVRAVRTRQWQAISHDLYDMSLNRLGQVDNELSTTDTFATAGFDVLEHVRNFREMFSKLSFTSEPSNILDATLVVLDVWSPYRFVGSDADEHPSTTSTFMLVNRRTEYGTSVPLVGSRHPSTIIPIS
jgi:hypothetical protein